MRQILSPIIKKLILKNLQSLYLTYIIIKIIDYVNGDAKVPTWTKRLILIISIIVVSTIYVILNYDNKITLLNSAILAPVFWSWIMRPIFIKLGIGYKQIDDYMN